MTTANERPLLGAVILLFGIFSVAMMDVTAKILTADVSVWQAVWARFFFHCLFLTPVAFLVWRRRRAVFLAEDIRHRERWGLHILRGLLLAASSVFFFIAIRDNPVPDALAVFFVEPLLVILLARFFLGERANRRLIIAALAGLVGVFVILRPGGGSGYSWTILSALLAALSFAGYLVMARFASFNTPAILTSWLTGAFGLLPTLPVFFFWSEADAKAWGLMAAVGFLSGVGHTLIILACRYAPAAYIAVLHYAEVGVATLISWWLFSHWPDNWVWVGIVFIASANLYALFGDKLKRRQAV